MDNEDNDSAELQAYRARLNVHADFVQNNINPAYRKAAHAVLRDVDSTDRDYIRKVLREHGLTGAPAIARQADEAREQTELEQVQAAAQRASARARGIGNDSTMQLRSYKNPPPTTADREAVIALAKRMSATCAPTNPAMNSEHIRLVESFDDKGTAGARPRKR